MPKRTILARKYHYARGLLDSETSIPFKANRVLNLILIAFLLILIRCWHLAVIQYEEKLENSRKPQRKTIFESAKRATIRDRFNIPLAINKVRYHAAIVYSQMWSIPTVKWETDAFGKKTKKAKRKEYIRKLSELLADELSLDADRIEDLIHAKAASAASVPFLIKQDISEKEYFRLKMLEKDWLGLQVQVLPKREYPQKHLAAEVVGYLGAISRKEYEKVLHEMKHIENFFHEWNLGEEPALPNGFTSLEALQKRQKELEELAYTIHDHVGKTGVESWFEQELRGLQGKKTYFSDARGSFLKEIPPASHPVAGNRFLLTLSSELQEYAEKLLAINEKVRTTRLSAQGHSPKALKEPWIKGGAVVVMDPSNGEILTLATFPRFDPNDFIPSGNSDENQHKQNRIKRWFESEAYLAALWNQELPLEREIYNAEKEALEEEKKWLTWDFYLDLILAKDGELRTQINQVKTIKQAIQIQRAFKEIVQPEKKLLEYWKSHPDLASLSYLDHLSDRFLFIDLCHLVVDERLFSDELLQLVGEQTLTDYRNISASMGQIKKVVRNFAKTVFHEADFAAWRKESEKEFLKIKRLEEKASKRYPKPYIDYLDEEEKKQFQSFWKAHQWELIFAFLSGKAGSHHLLDSYINYFDTWFQELTLGAHPAVSWRKAYDTLQKAIQNFPKSSVIPYLQSLRGFEELNRPLLNRYVRLRNGKEQPTEKHLAQAFYPQHGYGYARSQAFRQAATQGSIFKIVTAYEALVQEYQKKVNEGKKVDSLNPLEMVDRVFKIGKTVYVGYNQDGKPIPQIYKGGRIPRSLNYHLGKLDLLGALEHSSNPYFSLLAAEVLEHPTDLARAASLFSFGVRTGIEIPGEIPGKIPTDLATNRTGLYATAIGQHTLVVTPLQTSVMLSAFANGGKVFKPQIVSLKVTTDRDGFSTIHQNNPVIKHEVSMPEIVRNTLFEGMRRVVLRTQGESIWTLSRIYAEHPEAISDYIDLKNQLIGKTSTSEVIESLDLDYESSHEMFKHVWFGGVAFKEDQMKHFEKPELVVVVYLRYGGYGKEAAPLASQIVKKWREIKQRHISAL